MYKFVITNKYIIMKSTILTTLLGLILFSSFTSTDPVVENKSIDVQKSMVEWKAYKMGGPGSGTNQQR